MSAKKYSEFGKLILKRLIDIGMSQDELAKKSKVLPCSISNYCAGRAYPSAQSVYRLAKALDMNVEELIEAIIAESENKAS